MRKQREELDKNTKQYIRRIRIYQFIVLIIIMLLFVLFARTIVLENKKNLKEVVLPEVQESMQETVNNLCIRIDVVRAQYEDEVMADIIDLSNRIQRDSVKDAEELLSYLMVCDENELEQAIEAVYTDSTGRVSYITAYERDIIQIEATEGRALYKEVPVCDVFSVDGQEVALFIQQKYIDELTKDVIRNFIHFEYYEGNQYVWVNEVLNMEGGENYAVRRIHPNLIESEGEYLSTSMQDVVGNYPYKTELEGIREKGHVFHSYYFKNKVDDEVMEKFSYAQYYEPFNWIIATGETLEEVYAYSEEINERSIHQIFSLMLVFIVLFAITSGIMIGVLGKQAKSFRRQILKQTEVIEDIYATMSAGLLRIQMTDTNSTVIKINPIGLELLGVETERELISKIKGHAIGTIHPEDEVNHIAECLKLQEQWESVVVECHVTWKDGSVHLLRVRDTLIEVNGRERTIQRMMQDITEERLQQEKALMEAEEKATLDPMTQIKNKKAIETIIRTQILEATKKDVPIAIGFVDIDNFRDYNTKYGHMQGDEVIKYVASTIKEFIPGIVGRNGGDEFAFCIYDASYEQVESAMKIIHQKLNEGIIVKETGEKIPTPCSIGVVIERKKELDYDYVMEQSDEAMYEAKAKGKNTYHILNNV